jgi:hypothetical protein
MEIRDKKETLNINMTLYSIKKYGANEKIISRFALTLERVIRSHTNLHN